MDKKRIILLTMLSMCMCGVEIGAGASSPVAAIAPITEKDKLIEEAFEQFKAKVVEIEQIFSLEFNLKTEDPIEKFKKLGSFISSCFLLRDDLIEKGLNVEELYTKLTELYAEINKFLEEKTPQKNSASLPSLLSKLPKFFRSPKAQSELKDAVPEVSAENEAAKEFEAAVNTAETVKTPASELTESEKQKEIEKFKEILSQRPNTAQFKIKAALLQVMNLLFGKSSIKQRYISEKSLENFARKGILVDLYEQMKEILGRKTASISELTEMIDKYNKSVINYFNDIKSVYVMKKEQIRDLTSNYRKTNNPILYNRYKLDNTKGFYEQILVGHSYLKTDVYAEDLGVDRLGNIKLVLDSKPSKIRDCYNRAWYSEGGPSEYDNIEASYEQEKGPIDSWTWENIKELFAQKIEVIKSIATPTQEKQKLDALFQDLLEYVEFVYNVGIGSSTLRKFRTTFTDTKFKEKNFVEKVEYIERIINFLLEMLDSSNTFASLRP